MRYIAGVSGETKSTPAGRLLLAFQMADFGIALMRENLRKRFPSESDAQIRERLAAWLERPQPADDDLKAVPWPR